MTPNWSSNREPDLDPAVAAAVRGVMDAIADLDTARIRLEHTDIEALLNEPAVVDEEFMSNLAATPIASPELQAYAARVADGECRWSDIEQLARPVPPEVHDMKTSPRFIWHWTPEPPPPPPTPRKRNADTVGPSDWPDDFDSYPTPKSWLQ